MGCFHAEQEAEQIKFANQEYINCDDHNKGACKNDCPFQDIRDLPVQNEIAKSHQDSLVHDKKRQYSFIDMMEQRTVKWQMLHTKPQHGEYQAPGTEKGKQAGYPVTTLSLEKGFGDTKQHVQVNDWQSPTQ